MFRKMNVIALALFLPVAAFAGGDHDKGDKHHMDYSDSSYDAESYQLEGVQQAKTLAEAHKLEEHYQYSIDRRKEAWEASETAIDDAREERKMAYERREAARDAVENAVESGIGVQAAIHELAVSDRAVMEARDYVKLQKAREHAAEERYDREIARYDLAVARRKVLEEKLEDGWDDTPHRLERKVQKRAEALRDDERRYQLALAHVRERRQDYYSPTTVVQVWNYQAPKTPMTDGEQAAQNETPMSVQDLRRVHFELESAELDTDALNDLAWNAHVLRNNPEVTVQIEGHTDLTGTKAFNRELAWDRAEAVQDYLISQGVYEDQVALTGYGETMPIRNTKDASKVNRRVEFRVLMDPDGLVDSSIDNPAFDDGYNTEMDAGTDFDE